MSKYNTCRFCGEDLNEDYKSKLYCSRECGDSYRSRKRTMEKKMATKRECRTCKVEFIPNYKGTKTFDCSEECYKEQRRKRNRERMRKINPPKPDVTIECEWCGKEHNVPARTAHQARFCSAKCNDTWWSRQRGHRPQAEWVKLREKQKEETRKKKEAERKARIKTKDCSECGESFKTIRPNKLTCSTECSRKRENRLKSLLKDERIPDSQMVDRDISLTRLYKRDNGICYLCNEKCDYSDVKITKDGYKYAGPTYPSIDHVMPVVHGGLHAWDNVRLAHHRCNAIKSDTIPDDLKELLPDDAYSVARKISPRMKTTLQFNTKGKLVGTYESTAQAERETGVKQKGIQKCARGECKTYGGYVWEYA